MKKRATEQDGQELGENVIGATESKTTDSELNNTETEQDAVVIPPDANIVYIGPEGKEITKINNGMEVIKLPSVEEQANPFFHKKAATIIRLFPGHYKLFKKKGE